MGISDDPFMIGSVIFDIFVDPKDAKDFEDFKKKIEEMGAKIEIKTAPKGSKFIRVHNDEKPLPDEVLDYADDWAGSHPFSHAYR